ncbi:MAG: hypothetical protein NT086_12875 [Proteobacteria bacterium]|nr:hypothetical protein [Pseudomonadota bacterium]
MRKKKAVHRPKQGRPFDIQETWLHKKLGQFWAIPGTKFLLLFIVPPLIILAIPCLAIASIWMVLRGKEDFGMKNWKDRLVAGAVCLIFFYFLLATGSYLLEFISTGNICSRPTRHVASSCSSFADAPWMSSFYFGLYFCLFFVSLYVTPLLLALSLSKKFVDES